MYQTRYRKSFFTSFLLGSLCLFIHPGSAQDMPTTTSRHAWRDPFVSEEYKKWLREDVVYIATHQERAEFRNLTSDKQRDEFIIAFWERRNPMLDAAHNPFKEEHYRRLAYANAHFGAGPFAGWKTDRGRIYIIYGPPGSVESHPGFSPPIEIWRYASAEEHGPKLVLTFTDKDGSGDYPLTDEEVNSLPRIRNGQRIYW